jgi:hypothetical protein
MTLLLFNLSDTPVLIGHALDARGHIPTCTERECGEPGSPALNWAKDEGTYLMSKRHPSSPRLKG